MSQATVEALPPTVDKKEIERRAQLAAAAPPAKKPIAPPLSLEEFLDANPEKRKTIIENMLRVGETMNIIAASKAGKSWLILGLLLAIASGRNWLGRAVTKGKVLLIDNELHPEELASRIRKAMQRMEITEEDIGDRFEVKSLRGALMDIRQIAAMVSDLKEQKYILIALDAFYRTLPEGVSENDNAQMAAIYNTVDSMAGSINCAVVLNHHASKGDQSGKAITDMGSGAGSISRAADTHLIIRPHELDSHSVLDGVCRSFPPLEPMTIRYEYPAWYPTDVQPRVRRPQQGPGSDNEKRDQESDDAVLEFLSSGQKTKWEVRKQTGWGQARVDRTIQRLIDLKKIVCEPTFDQKTNKEAEILFVPKPLN